MAQGADLRRQHDEFHGRDHPLARWARRRARHRAPSVGHVLHHTPPALPGHRGAGGMRRVGTGGWRGGSGVFFRHRREGAPRRQAARGGARRPHRRRGRRRRDRRSGSVVVVATGRVRGHVPGLRGGRVGAAGGAEMRGRVRGEGVGARGATRRDGARDVPVGNNRRRRRGPREGARGGVSEGASPRDGAGDGGARVHGGEHGRRRRRAGPVRVQLPHRSSRERGHRVPPAAPRARGGG
mmetsp:Transcript_10770/g.44805  ORF Transcript_10770/g.44805 Transcript_10770/m.44805 type:complete len:239 (-) Transcript_10770:186-902(-)